MKKMLIALFMWSNIAYCQNYEGLVTNTAYGGLALAVNGNSGVYPGPALCIEPVRNISPYFALGGHLDYAWFQAKKPSTITEDFTMGVHILDLALVPKAMYPISNRVTATLEIDPGLYVTYFYYIVGTTSSSSVGKFFGLTEGLSLRLKPFVFLFKFKTMFANIFKTGFDNMFSKDNTLSWMTLSVGMEL